MWSAFNWPLDAAKSLVAKIRDYLVRHSPPPEGPLRELGRVRIVETIAEMMQPGPILDPRTGLRWSRCWLCCREPPRAA